MLKKAMSLFRQETGLSSIEYALIAGIVVLAIIGAIVLLSQFVGRPFVEIANSI